MTIYSDEVKLKMIETIGILGKDLADAGNSTCSFTKREIVKKMDELLVLIKG